MLKVLDTKNNQKHIFEGNDTFVIEAQKIICACPNYKHFMHRIEVEKFAHVCYNMVGTVHFATVTTFEVYANEWMKTVGKTQWIVRV